MRRFILVAMGAALFVGLSISYGQSGSDIPMQSASPATVEQVQDSFERDLGDGFRVRGRLLVSETLTKGSRSVRVIGLVLDFSNNGERSGSASLLKTADSSSNDALRVAGAAGTAGRLGRIQVRPATGKNWGQVNGLDDIAISSTLD